MISERQIVRFQNQILHWYSKYKRDLPWREVPYDISLKQRDPYRILVSEVMLQQTQVTRVIPKYEAWLKQFPTIERLAKASIRDVLRAWSGLGYNRRPLYLREAAKIIVEKFDRVFPGDVKTLWTLPGIGEYTARAVSCFAFDQQIAVVDTNVRKVILIEFFKGKVPDRKTLQAVADHLLPKGRAYEWNQALMDYSAAMLKDQKIPIPKQSKFIGSDRYYRGQIMKLLVQKEVAGIDQVEKLFNSKHRDRFGVILKRMKKDGLIQMQEDAILLPS